MLRSRTGRSNASDLAANWLNCRVTFPGSIPCNRSAFYRTDPRRHKKDIVLYSLYTRRISLWMAIELSSYEGCSSSSADWFADVSPSASLVSTDVYTPSLVAYRLAIIKFLRKRGLPEVEVNRMKQLLLACRVHHTKGCRRNLRRLSKGGERVSRGLKARLEIFSTKKWQLVEHLLSLSID